jgi:acetolactate synthase-1/2/3 large subunit
MACGYSTYSKRLGVCFATAGPGAFNLFSGLGIALADSLPVLAITGFASLDWIGKGGLNETTGLNRTPDSNAMFAATTKRSYLLRYPSQTCDMLEEAVNVAFEGRPGPVHIHVPSNLTHRGISVANYRDIRLNVKPVLPDATQIAAAAAALVDAFQQKKRVLAVIGFGAYQSNAASELLAFVERFQLPFVTTLNGKGILPENHPLCLGILANSGNKGAADYFDGADVVVGIGNSFSQNSTYDFDPVLFDNKIQIHINIDWNEIGKVYKADYGVVSDAKLALVALRDQIAKSIGEIAPIRLEKDGHQAQVLSQTGPRIHPGRLAQSLSKYLPEKSIVLADAGSHLAWLGHYLELSRGQFFHKPGSFGPMACHVNGALGIKLAHPDRTVIVGCGDGCYLLSGFELLTAVQYNIPVIWIIFEDGEFNIIRFYQMANFGEFALVDFNNPDYVTFAKACGARGFRVETIDQFESALQEALASGKPTIIDAAIDPNAVPPFQAKP